MPQVVQLGRPLQNGAREIIAVHDWPALPRFLTQRTDFVLPTGDIPPEARRRVADFCLRNNSVERRHPAAPQHSPALPAGGVTWAACCFGHGSSFPWFNQATVTTLIKLGIRTKILWWPPESIDFAIPLPRVLRPEDIDGTAAVINCRWTPPARAMTLCRQHAAAFLGYFQAEGTMVQPALAHWMNFHFKAMLATSIVTKRALETSGVSIPVHVFGHGIDPHQFPFVDRPIDRRPYTFFHFADVQARKGTDALIKAFMATQRRDIRLYIKAQWENPESKEYRKMSASDSRIVWDFTSYPPKMLSALIAQMDCGVFPSRGEGFGIPKLECEATGLPTIATRWGGYLDHSVEGATLLLDAKEIPAAIDKGKWAEPSVDHLVELITRCVENPEWAKDCGRRASENAHKNWTWTKKVGELISILQTYTPALRSAIKQSD